MESINHPHDGIPRASHPNPQAQPSQHLAPRYPSQGPLQGDHGLQFPPPPQASKLQHQDTLLAHCTPASRTDSLQNDLIHTADGETGLMEGQGQWREAIQKCYFSYAANMWTPRVQPSAPASVLQDWKSMEEFVAHIGYFGNLRAKNYATSLYVTLLEQGRGNIRLWGVGEGLEENMHPNIASPPDTSSLWGKVAASSLSTLENETPRETKVVGGLGPDGLLELDDETLRRLHGSYMANMHILQPILNPSKLIMMLEAFRQAYGPGAKLNQIPKSIRNAIVLLVLAIGKVCECKNVLPGPLPDYVEASSTSLNINIMPGMAYFSVATDMLGNTEHTMMHVQAKLLAGLYLGQYARVLESWAWIYSACTSCLVVIGGLESTILNTDAETRFAFLACLQLESDILAELSDLPLSGIAKYQDKISGDLPVMFERLPDRMFYSQMYYNHIYLRKVFNQAHDTLYNRNPPYYTEVAKASKTLQEWRDSLPAVLRWVDTDDPSTDINVARLRAEFYGGRYIILRPFLYMAIHNPDVSSLTIKLARQCIDAAILSTIAFDRVGCEAHDEYKWYTDTPKQRFIVTNIYSTLHAQFGAMLVLGATYSSKRQRAIFEEGTPITGQTVSLLFQRTIKVIRTVNSPSLEMNAEILEKLQRRLGLGSSFQSS